MKRRNLFASILGTLAALPVLASAAPTKSTPKNNRIVLLVEFVLGEAKHFDSSTTSRKEFHEAARTAHWANAQKLYDENYQGMKFSFSGQSIILKDELVSAATHSVWTLRLPSMSHVREDDIIMIFEGDKTPVRYEGYDLLIAESDGRIDDGLDVLNIEKYDPSVHVDTTVRWDR